MVSEIEEGEISNGGDILTLLYRRGKRAHMAATGQSLPPQSSAGSAPLIDDAARAELFAPDLCLRHFLSAAGLERYVGTFAEDEYDMLALRMSSKGDLEALGLPLGPRVMIYESCKKLGEVPDGLFDTHAGIFPCPYCVGPARISPPISPLREQHADGQPDGGKHRKESAPTFAQMAYHFNPWQPTITDAAAALTCSPPEQGAFLATAAAAPIGRFGFPLAHVLSPAPALPRSQSPLAGIDVVFRQPDDDGGAAPAVPVAPAPAPAPAPVAA
eukprot:SAG22_NODE_5897_length_934_cov_1.704192_1_plen_271_part_10